MELEKCLSPISIQINVSINGARVVYIKICYRRQFIILILPSLLHVHII